MGCHHHRLGPGRQHRHEPQRSLRPGGLTAGAYRVGFASYTDEGYLAEYHDNAATVATATDVPVTAGATTAGRDAKLTLGGFITGTLTGTAGVALPYVSVTAYQRDATNSYWAAVG